MRSTRSHGRIFAGRRPCATASQVVVAAAPGALPLITKLDAWGVRVAQISFAVADKEKRETKRWPPGPAHETTIRSGLAWPLGAGTEEE